MLIRTYLTKCLLSTIKKVGDRVCSGRLDSEAPFCWLGRQVFVIARNVVTRQSPTGGDCFGSSTKRAMTVVI